MWAKYNRLYNAWSDANLQDFRNCPLSNAKLEFELFRIPNFQLSVDAQGKNRILHRVVMSEFSGLIYANPCLTIEGIKCIPSGSYGHSAIRPKEQVDFLHAYDMDFTYVVDIGCGDGTFLLELPTGCAAQGLDINPPFANCEDFSTVQLDKTPPTIITMWHVLEHLPNPVETLKNLRSQAGEKTQLVVEVPILELALEQENQDICGFFTVQHLTHFTKRSLHSVLASAGWRINHAIPMSSYNGYRVIASPATWAVVGVKQEEIDHDEKLALAYVDKHRKNFRNVRASLKRIPENPHNPKKVVIWGAGQHTEYLERQTTLFNKTNGYLITDKDPQKHGSTYHGIPVLPPDQIPWEEADFVVISSYVHQEAITQELMKYCDRFAGLGLIKLYDNVLSY